MSGPSQANTETVTDPRQLAAYLEKGIKPRDRFRIGTEHEKFAFRLDDLRPLPYDGPCSIRTLLEGLAERGWTRVEEKGRLIALTHNGASVTLEPGGQVELSGAPLETLHQTCDETNEHLQHVNEITARIGAGMIGLGFNPKWRREDIPWMPKGRYKIMGAYMPKVGSLGLDMMLRTCTVQVNLDFSSEADMVKKFRVALALQPVATALFANSPFVDGKPSGFLSFRSHVWTDTDPKRCGMLPFVFETGMGFERYVDYLLNVPMYFVYRQGRYIDAAGQSFRDFMAGRLPALPGEYPTLGDWSDHLTVAFPEVRLKRILEMRGADGGPSTRLCALPALWVGLLYDDDALNEAAELTADWSIEEMRDLRDFAPRFGLKTSFRSGTVQDLALKVVEIARRGLAARKRLDASGADETRYLDPLSVIAERGTTAAENLLEAYHGVWNGSVDPVFRDYAY